MKEIFARDETQSTQSDVNFKKTLDETRDKFEGLSDQAKSRELAKFNLDGNVEPSELIINFTDVYSKFSNERLITQAPLAFVDAKIKARFKSSGAILVEFPSIKTRAELYAYAKTLNLINGVESVEGNIQVELLEEPRAKLPNDPEFIAKKLWGLKNEINPGADIRAEKIWRYTTKAKAIKVAVVDTGVDYSHPDLLCSIGSNPGEIGEDSQGNDKKTNRIDDDNNGYVDDYRGWNFVNNTNNPMDDHSHGTHVAGTIAACGNNGIGITGVAWQTQIVPVKFLNYRGSGTLANAVLAVEYAADLGVNISSNSWGGNFESEVLNAAVKYNADKGVLFVAAAGNSHFDNDTSKSSPANIKQPNVIAVAAVDNADKLASFSNYGKNSVHIAAPGVDILSTVPNKEYKSFKGTSMATPHVSGGAALLWSVNQGSHYSHIRNILLNNTDKGSYSAMLMNGRMNLEKAVAHSDINPPGAVKNFSILGYGTTTIRLIWEESGDDGDQGVASNYIIKFSENQILSEDDWSRAKQVEFESIKWNEGANGKDYQIARLQAKNISANSYLAIRAVDESNNQSSITGNVRFLPTHQIKSTAVSGFETDSSTKEVGWICNQTQEASDCRVENIAGTSTEFNLYWPTIYDYVDNLNIEFSHSFSLSKNKAFGYLEYSYDQGKTWTLKAAFSGVQSERVAESIPISKSDFRSAKSLKVRMRFVGHGAQDFWHISSASWKSRDFAPIMVRSSEGESPYFERDALGEFEGKYRFEILQVESLCSSRNFSPWLKTYNNKFYFYTRLAGKVRVCIQFMDVTNQVFASSEMEMTILPWTDYLKGLEGIKVTTSRLNLQWTSLDSKLSEYSLGAHSSEQENWQQPTISTSNHWQVDIVHKGLNVLKLRTEKNNVIIVPLIYWDSTPQSQMIFEQLPPTISNLTSFLLVPKETNQRSFMVDVQTMNTPCQFRTSELLEPRENLFLSKLNEGKYKICAIVLDDWNQKSDVQYIGDFEIDLTPAIFTVESRPRERESAKSFVVRFNSSDAVEFVYAIMKQNDCVGSKDWSERISFENRDYTIKQDHLEEGLYSFCVQIKDRAQNIGPVTKMFDWTVDRTGPVARFVNWNNQPIQEWTYRFEVGGDQVVQYYYHQTSSVNCSLRIGADGVYGPLSITEKIAASFNSDGVVKYCVYGVDVAGNIDRTPNVISVTIDVGPARVLLHGLTTTYAQQISLDLKIGGYSVEYYVWKIIGGSQECGVDGYSRKVSKDVRLRQTLRVAGNFKLCVRGIDAANNYQRTAHEVLLTIDQTPLVIDSLSNFFSGVPIAGTKVTSESLDIRAISSEVGSFNFVLVPSSQRCNSATYPAVTPANDVLKVNLKIIEDGQIKICSRVYDKAGNLTQVEVENAFNKINGPIEYPNLSYLSLSVQSRLPINISFDGLLGAKEYSYKVVRTEVGQCNLGTYSSWVPITEVLTLDLGSQNAAILLCYRLRNDLGQGAKVEKGQRFLYFRSMNLPSDDVEFKFDSFSSNLNGSLGAKFITDGQRKVSRDFNFTATLCELNNSSGYFESCVTKNLRIKRNQSQVIQTWTGLRRQKIYHLFYQTKQSVVKVGGVLGR